MIDSFGESKQIPWENTGTYERWIYRACKRLCMLAITFFFGKWMAGRVQRYSDIWLSGGGVKKEKNILRLISFLGPSSVIDGWLPAVSKSAYEICDGAIYCSKLGLRDMLPKWFIDDWVGIGLTWSIAIIHAKDASKMTSVTLIDSHSWFRPGRSILLAREPIA